MGNGLQQLSLLRCRGIFMFQTLRGSDIARLSIHLVCKDTLQHDLKLLLTQVDVPGPQLLEDGTENSFSKWYSPQTWYNPRSASARGPRSHKNDILGDQPFGISVFDGSLEQRGYSFLGRFRRVGLESIKNKVDGRLAEVLQ